MLLRTSKQKPEQLISHPTAWLSLPPTLGDLLWMNHGTAGAGQQNCGVSSARLCAVLLISSTKLTRGSQKREVTHPSAPHCQTTGKPKVQMLSSGDTCQTHRLELQRAPRLRKSEIFTWAEVIQGPNINWDHSQERPKPPDSTWTPILLAVIPFSVFYTRSQWKSYEKQAENKRDGFKLGTKWKHQGGW